jgi:hypothetical protein
MTIAPSWDTPWKSIIEGAEYVDVFRVSSQGILYRAEMIFPIEEDCEEG